VLRGRCVQLQYGGHVDFSRPTPVRNPSVVIKLSCAAGCMHQVIKLNVAMICSVCLHLTFEDIWRNLWLVESWNLAHDDTYGRPIQSHASRDDMPSCWCKIAALGAWTATMPCPSEGWAGPRWDHEAGTWWWERPYLSLPCYKQSCLTFFKGNAWEWSPCW
jgi:hypothetical protein